LFDRYATTIRTYDRDLKAWRVNFINPAAYETSANLIARRQGDGIEMEGRLADGTPIRWRYEKSTPTSFNYSAEKMGSSDGSWQLYLELFWQKNGMSRLDAHLAAPTISIIGRARSRNRPIGYELSNQGTGQLSSFIIQPGNGSLLLIRVHLRSLDSRRN
jgi:hypothetical protein